MTRTTLLFALAIALVGCDKSEADIRKAQRATMDEAAADVVVEDEGPDLTDPEVRRAIRMGEIPPPKSSPKPKPTDGGASQDPTPTEGEAVEEVETPDEGDVEAPVKAPAEGSATEKGPPNGLVALGNNCWEVPRYLADRWEAHPSRLGRVKEYGMGWKMTRVKYGSPGWWLGMRRGDVILKVNGMKLNTKAQMLAAYLKLKNKTEFDVEIDRGGKIVHHRYTIVD